MPRTNFEAFVVGNGNNIGNLAGTEVPLSSWSNSSYDWTTDTHVGFPVNDYVSYDLDNLNTSIANGGIDNTSPNANDGLINNATGQLIQAQSYVLWNNSTITAKDSAGNVYTYTGSMYGIQLADGTYIVHFQDPDQSSFQGGQSVLTLLANDGLTTLDVTSIKLGAVTDYSFQRSPSRFDYAWGDRPFTCFMSGTLIATPSGEVRVDDLKEGDEVCTLDNGARKIRWIGKNTLARNMLSDAKLCPIRIGSGALGDGMPNRDLYVSRQHRVLVRSQIAERIFGSTEVLVPAKDLVALEDVDLVTEFDEVTYYHLMFDQHEIIQSNGMPTESLYAGRQTLSSLRREQREEILTLFPELAERDAQPDSIASSVRARMRVSLSDGT